MYSIKIYNNLEDDRLKKHWKEIYSKSNYYLQNSYDWISIWWKHFRKKSRKLFIVTIEENDAILGIAPFMIEGNILIKELRFIGSGLTDFHEILALPEQEENILKYILDFIRTEKKYSVINLEQISDNSELFRILDKDALYTKREMVKCPIANFNASTWDEYRMKLSGKFRRNWNWGFNKLSREGDIKFVWLKDVVKKEDYLEKIFHLHSKRWKYKKRASKFDQEVIQKFITELISEIPEIGICVLIYKEAMISYWIGFLQKDVYYGWNTAFDPAFYKYSVGQILTGLLIQSLIANNFKKFNFMRGDEDYKRKWMTDEETLTNYQFLCKLNPIKGFLGVKYYLEWKWLIKKYFKKIYEKPLVQKILMKKKY